MRESGQHILIVDDNPMNRKLLVAILEGEGYTTVEASDGAEALRVMDTVKVDAIISDILMPNMDGYRFCYEVRKSKRHSRLPFILNTATYTAQSDEKLAIDLGADKLLKKPVGSKELLQALREVFDGVAYQEPRVITHPKTIEVIKEYRDALVSKLEEKTVELQKTTENLKASEELFRLITENAADLIAVLDLEGKRLYNSPSYDAFLGNHEKLRGTDSFREVHPDDRGRIRSIFRDTVTTGIGHRDEFRFVLKDGSVRHIESQGSVVRDPEGKPAKVVVVSRDVTERIRAGESLRKLSTALEQAGDNVVITDRDGVIEYVNPAFEKTSGFDREFAVGKTPGILKSGKHGESFYDVLWKTILSGNVFRGEFVNRKKNGELYYEQQTISPVFGAEGTITHFISSGKDVTEHKQMEQKIEESELRFRELTDTIKEVFWLTNPKKNEMLYISRGYEEIWGRACESLFANPTSWAESIHPDDRERVLNSAMTNQVIGKYDEEYRIVRPNGDIRWIHDRAFPVKDQTGEVVRVAGVAEDITERKLAEEALELAHSELKSLHDNLDEALFSVDTVNNKMLQVSIAHEKVFGHPRREFFKNPQLWYELIVPEDKLIVDAGFPVLTAGKGLQHQFRIARPDGEVRWIEAKIKPTLDSKGKLVRIDGIASDITDRRKADEALSQSEQKYRTLFEESKDGLFISTPEGKVIDVNSAVVAIFGYASREEALKLDVAGDIYVDPRDRQKLLDRLARENSIENFETVLKKKDGEKIHVLLDLTAVRDGKGDISMLRGIVKDVTKHRQLEQQLFQAQKLESLGTLAGGIAHDFNNILGIIMGHSSILGRREMDRDRMVQSTDAITKASHRGAALVRQLLTFARKTDPLLESVNVNDIIAELAKLFEETFPKTITISLTLAEDLPGVLADGNQLHQTFLNLCVNARDAMPDGGTLSISTSVFPASAVRREFPNATSTSYVCIRSTDSGTGMSEATRQRIFEPFFTTKGVGKGTGLGLAVVYGIVKGLNGHISVQSSVGKGTTFTVYLPVAVRDQPDFEEPVFEPADIPGGNETILVVEDEEMLMDLLATLLETKGYRVLRAADGEQAVNMYQDHEDSIALVLSDFGLPKCDGFAAFLKMKEINSEVKAIIASGYMNGEQQSVLQEGGVKKIFLKPYVPYEILKCIREVIGDKQIGK